MIRRTRTALITGVVVAALAASGGVAYAVSSTSSPTPSTSSSQSASTGASTGKAKAKHRAGLLAHVAHGEVTLDGPHHRVIDFQRGQVQSVSSTSITVKSDDGFTASYTVNGNTKVRKAGKASAIGSVATGDKVVVQATKSGSTDTANRIGDR